MPVRHRSRSAKRAVGCSSLEFREQMTLCSLSLGVLVRRSERPSVSHLLLSGNLSRTKVNPIPSQVDQVRTLDRNGASPHGRGIETETVASLLALKTGQLGTMTQLSIFSHVDPKCCRDRIKQACQKRSRGKKHVTPEKEKWGEAASVPVHPI